MPESLSYDPRPEDMTSVDMDEAFTKFAAGERMSAHEVEAIKFRYPDVIESFEESDNA